MQKTSSSIPSGQSKPTIVSTFKFAVENPDGWECTHQLRWKDGILEQKYTNKYTTEEEWHAVPSEGVIRKR